MLQRLTLNSIRLGIFCFLVSSVLQSQSPAQAPVFAITQEDSTIKFYVKASVSLVGTFKEHTCFRCFWCCFWFLSAQFR
jgi:hypothetical protein